MPSRASIALYTEQTVTNRLRTYCQSCVAIVADIRTPAERARFQLFHVSSPPFAITLLHHGQTSGNSVLLFVMLLQFEQAYTSAVNLTSADHVGIPVNPSVLLSAPGVESVLLQNVCKFQLTAFTFIPRPASAVFRHSFSPPRTPGSTGFPRFCSQTPRRRFCKRAGISALLFSSACCLSSDRIC